jgi:hypothetical protein
MRSNLLVGISSAVAAVAVAGSANAGVVDPFTTNQSFGTSATSWTNLSGALFDQRNARRVNNGGGTGVSSANNNVAFTLARSGSSPSQIALNYQMSGGAPKDLSSIASMSIALSALNLNVLGGTAATGVEFEWQLQDENFNYMGTTQILSTNGTSTFNFASADYVDPGFDLTKATYFSLIVSQVGGSTSGSYSTISSSGTLSNFSYTLVPAPGAIALLGAAGLVGGRRRKA